MRIGSGPNAAVQGQSYDASAVVLPPPLPPVAVPPSSAPSPSLSTSSTLIPTLVDAPEPDTKRSSNLVKPSSFFGPPPSCSPLIPPDSSSVPTAPPLHPPGNLQCPYGAPLLQPFPPPNPPPSHSYPKQRGLRFRDKVNRDLPRLYGLQFLAFLSE
ncbi:mRNA-decapping enzyme-like protein [Lycium barbarum]|uniref:mRNA-decapping enzyme-like protein n=1 Tax=Lycium barbarum TaxID=112863 RepID=UPI00293EA47C|nr:mRNA-decapping enzyme-like protein [Lycium barbarum]